jgi:hypothetical protein
MYKQKRDRTNADKSSMNLTSSAAYLDSTKDRFASAMNYLHQKKNILFSAKVVDILTAIVWEERQKLGKKMVMRVAINNIEDGMIFAEDYFTSFGLLIAASGETVTKDMIGPLVKFAEAGQIPHKILVIK